MRKPSTERNTPWIYVEDLKKTRHKINYDFTGKWLIFATLTEVDQIWKIISQATEEGLLGFASKVSTMFPTKYDPNKKVICVYTRDYRDKEDVLSIREQLRQLGFTDKLVYKTDAATRAGIYGSNQEFLYKE